MPVFVGGAELNVATALSHWNMPVGYVTALPQNYLTEHLLQYLKSKHIDTSTVHFSGDRIGAYYLPQGEELKHAGVIYDRQNSSFSNLKTGMIDWGKVLSHCSWLHLSAINPSINKDVGAVCIEAVKVARAMDIPVSFDLNYREKLWNSNSHAANSIHEILEYATLIMGNIWAQEKMLGIDNKNNFQDDKEAYLEQSQHSSEEIISRYPYCKIVANTFRINKENKLRYYATLFTENVLLTSTEFETDQPVNKTGSGDAFMAGLIYGILNGQSSQQILNFAAAAAFKKLFEPGDALAASVEEINNTMQL